jgi:hypothetical protein
MTAAAANVRMIRAELAGYSGGRHKGGTETGSAVRQPAQM